MIIIRECIRKDTNHRIRNTSKTLENKESSNFTNNRSNEWENENRKTLEESKDTENNKTHSETCILVVFWINIT